MKVEIFAVILQAESYIKKESEKQDKFMISKTSYLDVRNGVRKQSIKTFVIISSKYLLAANYKRFYSYKGKNYSNLGEIDNIKILQKANQIKKLIKNNL